MSLEGYLLESYVQIESDGLSGIADHGQAVLLMGGRGAGYQLHCVCSRIVSNLDTERGAAVPPTAQLTGPPTAQLTGWGSSRLSEG